MSGERMGSNPTPGPIRAMLRLEDLSAWLVPMMNSWGVPFRLEDSQGGLLGDYEPDPCSSLHAITLKNETIAALRVPAEARCDAAAIALAISQHASARHAIHDLAGSLTNAWKETNFNFDLAQHLNEILDVSEACHLIVRQLARMQRAHSVQLYLQQDDVLVLAAAHPQGDATYLEEAMTAMAQGRPQIVAAEGISLVCLPLLQGMHNLGALCLRGDERLSHAANVKFLSSVSAWIAQAIRHRYLVEQEMLAAELRRELELAAEIQRGLHPKTLPRIPGVAIASRYLPAQFVGGDGFDAVVHERGLDLLIADVSGHGVAAGLLISNFMSMMRSQDRPALAPAEFAKKANLLVCRDVGASDYYMTGLVSRLTPDARTLIYSTMGHPPPLLWREGKLVSLPVVGGMPAGLWEDGDYEEGEVALLPGDKLLFLTDGLIEARSPDGCVFGLEGVGMALAKAEGLEPDAVLEVIFEACSGFAQGKIEDDRTAILLEIHEELP